MTPLAFRVPSAWLPIVMSLGALGVLLGHLFLYGDAPDADEGAAAHVWQLLVAGQVPIIAWFLFRWFPRERTAAAPVLLAQAIALLAAVAPIAVLGL